MSAVVGSGCSRQGDAPYRVVWDASTDAGPPRSFIFLTAINPASPSDPSRFVLTSLSEWESGDPEIGVWIDGEHVPVERSERVVDLDRFDAEAYLRGLNEQLASWGRDHTDWREARLRTDGATYALTLVDHGGRSTRFTWSITDGDIEPRAVEMLDVGAMAQQFVARLFLAFAIVCALVVALLAVIVCIFVSRRRSRSAA